MSGIIFVLFSPRLIVEEPALPDYSRFAQSLTGTGRSSLAVPVEVHPVSSSEMKDVVERRPASPRDISRFWSWNHSRQLNGGFATGILIMRYIISPVDWYFAWYDEMPPLFSDLEGRCIQTERE